MKRLLGTFALLALATSACGSSHRGPRAGGAAAAGSVEPGDPAHNLLKASTFEDGIMLPWNTSFSAPADGAAEVKDGALCVHVAAKGANRWDAQIRHREMVIEKGQSYRVSFRAWASRKTNVAGKIGMSGPPYSDYWTRQLTLSPEPQSFSFDFAMKQTDDATAEFAFHVGGHMVLGDGPVDICFDDLILSDPDFTPPPKAALAKAPPIRVNQLGYLPKLAKVSTLVTESDAPQDWKLLDAAGASVAEGKTQPFGKDADSGDKVALIDFSSVTKPGKGYVLTVGADKSDPFSIDATVFAPLTKDAFKFFYFARSGAPLELPWAEEKRWTRAAGHPKDEVGCGAGFTCPYRLDVTGGWYDAGDYGKYVVNGGISAWTLMNLYERNQLLGKGQGLLGDDSKLIPETGNKVADLLDEARWELEFMLRMQVPAGQPNAGMVHHKMHDTTWSALGIAPGDSKAERALRPTSTAATLNLAATAAQAARIWKDLDPKFSAKCLAAAQRAWAAALANPAVFAPASDTTGGGPYDDTHVDDEFYWAAAELYLTTGDPALRAKLDAAPTVALGEPGSCPTSMTWQVVDTLGRISLATVGGKLTAAERDAQRAEVIKLADRYLETLGKQGYRLPYAADAKDGYPWGSNSSVLNNMVILALAGDFTKDAKYANAVEAGMDYLLGRNAMGQSYITGYGTRPLKNPHHRFFANQASAKFPEPPRGFISGGPNSGLQDPYVKAAGLKGCAPQKCFLDNIEAWSANEVTINWNAPLTWVASWLNEQGK
jgi:endoglucanase